MKRGKFLGAAVAVAVALTGLTGCTASDQRIIDSFTEPKTIAKPAKSDAVEDPSMKAYRDSQPKAVPTKTYTVKVYGSVESAQISVDAGDDIVQFLPYKETVKAEQSVVITGSTKSKTGGCTILDAAGKIIDKQTATGKRQLFTCIVTN